MDIPLTFDAIQAERDAEAGRLLAARIAEPRRTGDRATFATRAPRSWLRHLVARIRRDSAPIHT